MECNFYGLGGLARAIAIASDQSIGDLCGKKQVSREKEKDLSKAMKQEMLRRKTFLRMGMRPICIYDVNDPMDQQVYTPHSVSIPQLPMLAISRLTEVLSKEFQDASRGVVQEGCGDSYLSPEWSITDDTALTVDKTRERERSLKIDIMTELAQFTGDAADTYQVMIDIKSREADFGSKKSITLHAKNPKYKELVALIGHLKEASQSSANFWMEAGQVIYFQIFAFIRTCIIY